MTKPRPLALAFVVLLVSALPARAGAQSSEDYQRKDAAATKRSQLAAQIDVLRANDRELEAAVQALDAGITVQSNATEAAQQAAVAAQVALGSAEARLAATERRVAELREKASAVAIRSYMNPGSLGLLEIVKARDLSEASRRQTLLSHVVSTERDVLGELRAARQDLQAEQDNLEALRDQAQERKRQAAEKLASLQSARSEQQRLRNALDVRIREYTAEVDALAREEATIVALIQSRQASSPAPARVSNSGMIWPIGGPVTSGFGLRWGRMHTGIDIGAGHGTPIRAARGGTVIMAAYNGGYGLCVIIDHGGGLTTLYAHQSRMTVGSGESVSQGEVIGYVGTTGNSTGAHLHFETRMGGSAQNPMRYLP
jgi:murein DD-endopeptidase MepM/ murein hydrolase activator NlpD